MTFDQQEPSANSPCTKTTFLVFGEVWALARSILYLIVAIGLGVYLKKLRRLYHLR